MRGSIGTGRRLRGAHPRRNVAAVRTLACFVCLAVPAVAAAEDPAPAAEDPGPAAEDPAPAAAPAEDAPEEPGALHWKAGGYLQPQLRLRQDDPVAPADENGFRVRRARVTAEASRHYGCLTFSAALEAELTPDFSLLDASVGAGAPTVGDGAWRIEAGQLKAPVSRQALLSDSRLGFVDKAELASLAPERQIGALATVDVPYAPGLRVQGGLFNGEGRNLGGNVDQRFLYAARVELAPIGRAVKLAESDLGGDYLVVGGSAAIQRRDSGDGLDRELTLGADLAFGYRGASGTVEYLQVSHTPIDQARPAFRANGIVVQLAYLVPIAALQRRLEVGARWEEIDRNDKIPIVRVGDPNQSLRYFTGALNWYQHAHALKLQLAASHIVEVEDRDVMGKPAAYANDTLLLQATFRIE